MKNKYQLTVGSPLDYDKLVVYIEVNNEDLGLIHMEKRNNKIEFEFFKIEEKVSVNLDTFIEALIKAKEELLK